MTQILKNLSDQDICSDSKDLIDCARNTVDLYDQRDSKGQILFSSFKIWNILDKIFVLIYVQSKELSAIQQFQRYAIVFQNVLAYNSLIGYEDFLWTKKQQAICGGMMGKSSRQPYAQQLEGLGLIWSWSIRSALEGAPMDVMHHSEIVTQNAMTEVTNHIKVLLNTTENQNIAVLNLMSVLWS